MCSRALPAVLLLLPLWIAWIFGCGDAQETTAIARNASDASILVRSIVTDGDSYRLKGLVLSAVPVGSAASILEAGQELTFTPSYRGGYPDPADSARAKLAALARKAPGDTVRCRITLEEGGAWRIVSAE